MMGSPETWLKSNTRAIVFGMVLPGFVLGLMLGLVWITPAELFWVRIVGGLIAVGAALVLILLLIQARRPRLAYRDGQLLAFLRTSRPLTVPIDLVEAFFLGRGPSMLPGEGNRDVQTMNLIVRLAERAKDYHEREVNSALGVWSEGYITIRGTWCEPLGTEVASRLNRRLHEVKQHRREQVAT